MADNTPATTPFAAQTAEATRYRNQRLAACTPLVEHILTEREAALERAAQLPDDGARDAARGAADSAAGWALLDHYALRVAPRNRELAMAEWLASVGIEPPTDARGWRALATFALIPDECDPEKIARAAAARYRELRAAGAQPAAASVPVIVQISDRAFTADGCAPIIVTAMEAAVLVAFADSGRPMTTTEIEHASGYQNPRKILSGFVKKHAGTPFAEAVRLPGRKGGGGYFVRVVQRD